MSAPHLTTDSLHPAHPPPPSETDADTSKPEESEASIDVNVLKEIAKRALVDTLNSVNGAKTLVLDPSLAGPLGLVTEVALLKHHGVDKMFWLEDVSLNVTTTNVVYLCRPHIKWMKIIANQIKGLASSTSPHTYTLVLVPRRTTLCDRVLEEEGVFGEVTISSYKLEFIPLEDDLVSLEYENTFREIFMEGDETSIYYAAQALITIQQAYGVFPRILGKGDAAKKLASLLVHLRAYPPNSSSNNARLSTPSDVFDSLVIIDRSVDLITPLLTQLTYQGLIDEFMGIKNSHVELDASLLNPQQPSTASSSTPGASSSTALPVTTATPAKKKKHHLTATSDLLFGQLRDLHFVAIGPKLNKEAHRLDEEYKERHQAQTVAQLREFVGKLGGLQNEQQSLQLHIRLSEQITPSTRTDIFNKSLEIQQNLTASYEPTTQVAAIEDLIAQQAPVQLVLRLLCLANLTTGGIKLKTLENIKRDIVQTYGYKYLPLLISLPALTLLTPNPVPKSTTSRQFQVKLPASFPPIRKSFRLLSDTPEANPSDISFTYSGYAPLSIRIIQAATMKGALLTNLNRKNGGAGEAPLPGASDGKPEKVAAHPITGWKGFEDALKLIPGEVVDESQVGTDASKVPSMSSRTFTMLKLSFGMLMSNTE
ncbi:hypothetical protein FRC02_002948 [Tulasnella sp. 418]|nr:hypothetical protein FRC02_002948 [Tulasnella sp. 418]